MLDSNFWQDKLKSQKIIKEKNFMKSWLILTRTLNKLKDLKELNQLAIEEKNINVQNEILENIMDLKENVKKNEIKCFLSNESDVLDCYIEIHAGAGGTESQDWAEMLRRIYIKWSDNKNFKSNLISEHKGDEAGIKSSTIKIEGNYVFGWLKKSQEYIDLLEFHHLIQVLEDTQVLQVFGFIL